MAEFKDTVDKVMSQLSGLNVEAIFGESRQFADKVVIPVGTISYGWGGGGGKGPSKGQEGEVKPEGEGSGMGMGVKVKPLGFITITADRVKYEPIIDMKPFILVFGAVAGLMFLKFSRMMVMKTMVGRCGFGGFGKHAKFGKHGMYGMHGKHGMHKGHWLISKE